ncbi:hypothetical protein [uncultured Bacteroides sp.]|uniref:hypothetical protein n=1 Tax=uncultured Bacteroides sp. TaxID=162156 RepID=UPI002AABC97B|nr:hypothetical protein [uncultured Bacteroides sp.]
MDRKLRIKTLIISLFLLFLIGVGTFFYTGISFRERITEVNLYSLVPSGCNAVFETNDLTSLIKEIKSTGYIKELPSLKLSRIANDLMVHFDSWVISAPHGVSSGMNRMLISFHSLGTETDQVVYFSTTPQNDDWIEQQIKKNRPMDFPIKTVSYRGKNIKICPMGGDSFLCYYKSAGFIAASYSERLIKQVIDTHVGGKSVLADPVFRLSQDYKNFNSIASLHLKMKQMGWSELNIKFARDVIRLSGTSIDADTSSSFVNALKEQSSIELLSKRELPRYTYYVNEMGISKLEYIAVNTSQQEYVLASYPDKVKAVDIHLVRFLKGYAANRLTSISFYPEDSIRRPLSLLYIPMKDSIKAEKDLQQFIQEKMQSGGKAQLLYAGVKSYQLYSLPKNTIFAQLSGIKDADLNSYAVFYKNLLLLAPDPVSILSYITQMDKYNTLKFDSPYNECITRMSPHLNYMLMADLAEVNSHPDNRSRFIPDFFFLHADFFNHFILSTQFVCKNRMVYPNLKLTYKEN